MELPISSFFNVLFNLLILSHIPSRSDLNDNSENSLYGFDKYFINDREVLPVLKLLKSS